MEEEWSVAAHWPRLKDSSFLQHVNKEVFTYLVVLGVVYRLPLSARSHPSPILSRNAWSCLSTSPLREIPSLPIPIPKNVTQGYHVDTHLFGIHIAQRELGRLYNFTIRPTTTIITIDLGTIKQCDMLKDT
jgi:hypothetical protein